MLGWRRPRSCWSLTLKLKLHRFPQLLQLHPQGAVRLRAGRIRARSPANQNRTLRAVWLTKLLFFPEKKQSSEGADVQTVWAHGYCPSRVFPQLVLSRRGTSYPKLLAWLFTCWMNSLFYDRLWINTALFIRIYKFSYFKREATLCVRVQQEANATYHCTLFISADHFKGKSPCKNSK